MTCPRCTETFEAVEYARCPACPSPALNGSVPRQGRIYPRPVKPATKINRWGDWPTDCVEQIRRLVGGWYPTGLFKCSRCEMFCQPHPHGVPHLKVGGRVVCDDCLIVLARSLPEFS